MQKVELIGITGIPIIIEGDDISKIIVECVKKNNISIEDGDIIVIAQTIISKSLGKTIKLSDVKPSQAAYEIYKKMEPLTKKFQLPIKEPELIETILKESSEIISTEHVMIVETKHGFICANAGIDKSNVEGNDQILLLPDNPDNEAEKIKFSLFELTGHQVAVIISDSFGRPFRIGAVGVALGVAGINPILDKRGSHDLFGKELKSTIIGQVDNLASAAQLVMGEADEGMPIVIIRGYEFKNASDTSINQILRDKESDLFRKEYQNKFLTSRRSYKFDFSKRSLEKILIKECINIARWAPSAHNGQFWRYIVMEKNQTRQKLIDDMNTKLSIDLKRDGYSEEFIRQKVEKTRNNFLNSPFLILLCLDSTDLQRYDDEKRSMNEFIMGIQSISASATYFLLALESKGIASCWYCAPLFAKKIIKECLNLPNTYIPMAFFTAGYPIKSIEPPPRKKLKEILYESEKDKNDK